MITNIRKKLSIANHVKLAGIRQLFKSLFINKSKN